MPNSDLFQFGPRRNFAVGVDFDVNHIRPTAYWTVLDVFLLVALREIDRNHDFLAACAADVGCFVVHAKPWNSKREP